MTSEKQIVQEIRDHIARCGGSYPDWYVGIAADPRDRLFNGHGVDEKTDAWIYRIADGSEAARRIERHFIDVLGTDGGPGGGDAASRSVYAYRKASHTNP